MIIMFVAKEEAITPRDIDTAPIVVATLQLSLLLIAADRGPERGANNIHEMYPFRHDANIDTEKSI